MRKLSTAGTFMRDSVVYKVDTHRAFQQVLVIADGKEPGDKITVTEVLTHQLSPMS